MRNELILVIIFSLFVVGLSGCQKENGKVKNLVIESSSVEFGSLLDPDDRNLHFRVQIIDSGMEPQLEYKVRFNIQNEYIRQLIETDIIEIPNTYKTNKFQENGSSGLVTGSSKVIKKEFDIDQIRKNLKNPAAVTVEIYDGNRIIAQDEVIHLKENIQPLVKNIQNEKLETIDLKEVETREIFTRAIHHATKETGISFIAHPKYSFSLDGETYLLWITEAEARIMKFKDPYTIYLLSNRSFNEIKLLVDNV
ncbi:hypothetical protein [Solibacillus sp. FSL K6-1523]|uniref:hypothetical protein n=1 Tax=Solibacillus sp. FSL K6-1523 TaxID=2921471 RepID=UPI0030F7B5C7